MARNEDDEKSWRGLLLLHQMFSWVYLGRLIPLAYSHWRGVLTYQAHSDHLSLPLGVQDSQHMMMIAVHLPQIKELEDNG